MSVHPLSKQLSIFPGWGIAFVFCFSTSYAQSSPITTSGLNTQVSGPIAAGAQTQYNITGGTRPGGGTNLFHSFGDFNVPNKTIANFLNSGSVDLACNQLAAGLPTSNILGRVTAGNPSVIFGMIQTNGTGGFGNANLFLMNPAGFLFGPNATVNVGGMVAFTTADYLRFQGNRDPIQQCINSYLQPAFDCTGGGIRLPRLQPSSDCHSRQHAAGGTGPEPVFGRRSKGIHGN